MQLEYSHPDEGLHNVLANLRRNGIREDSRNGPVLRFAEPVILVNKDPANRVSQNPIRDANPFFHFMEALWMLAGMNEVAPMAFYNGGIGQYSDDGQTLRGTAYGHKWRTHFGYDQLDMAIERLIANPADRRIVMTMWDPFSEWRDPYSKDLSCNLQVIFGTREVDGERVLDMEVTNRSNDIVFGCLGSNVFHFSFLLEYVAYHAGLKVGHYYQVAFNLHGYTQNAVFARCFEKLAVGNHYKAPVRELSASMMTELGLSRDPAVIRKFVETGDPGGDPYLVRVGSPIYEAYRVFKLKARGIQVPPDRRIAFAREIAAQCADVALSDAAVAWLGRRGESALKIVDAERPE